MNLAQLVAMFARTSVQPQIEVGTVGWADRDAYYDKGNPSGQPGDRHTLVYVTLFRGKDPTEAVKAGVAQGHQILARISGGLFRIPKKGSLVYLIVPHGMETTPGAAMIIAVAEDDPPLAFEDDRAVLSCGDDVHLVLRGKSVALQSAEDEFISVGTPRSGGTSGLTFQAKDGSGGVIQEGVVGWFVASDGDAKTIIQMTPEKVECACQGGGYWKVDEGGFYSFGASNTVAGAAVYLGRAPVATTAVAYRPPGLGTTVVGGSGSVFVSVT